VAPKNLNLVIMSRTPKEHLEYVKQHAPEYYEKYKEAIERTQKEEPPLWRRTNGDLIAIRDMNRFHLSGAMNIVIRYAKEQAEEQVKTEFPNSYRLRKSAIFEAVLPPVYYHLKDEMESRGMKVPGNPFKRRLT